MCKTSAILASLSARMAREESARSISARPHASLKKVLAYRNPDVVERFRNEYPVTRREAELIWLDTLRWLWLGATRETDVPLAITVSTAVIDEMWHTFVLFTKDYFAFCQGHFGRFIHHSPMTHDELLRFRTDFRADRERVTSRIAKERRAQYELVAERLGVDTLKRWYVDYETKYSPAVLRRLRRRGLAQAS